MSKIRELADLGQSIWYDYIRRSFITSGELKALIDEGLRGETSNPSILEKAIAGSSDYDDDIKRLVKENKSVEEIYEALALEDITLAADRFRPLYDSTEGADGFISLEVSPTLAHDTQNTIAEAKRYHGLINRPNLMIKVPATPEGIPAITELIGAGINVNVTLMFSLDHYRAVSEAYIKGLENLAAKGPSVPGGHAVEKIASVASFFVSRVDTAVDNELERIGNTSLLGKIAIANSKATYVEFQNTFSGPRWENLVSKGARVQRVLWASTSTKNPLYPDTLYVDELIGRGTVNTVPPVTYKNFRDHGTLKITITEGIDQAMSDLSELEKLGIDLTAVTRKLQDDGVVAFAKSFEALMSSIEDKRDRLIAEKKGFSASLGQYKKVVDDELKGMEAENINQRIWNFDFFVWKDDPTEISNRLGWLHIPEVMIDAIPGMNLLVDSARADGYRYAVLLGMGGSSLAPYVFRETFGVKKGYLDLSVLDSSDPGAVQENRNRVELDKTLFIVSTKSGSTNETLSFMRYFFNEVSDNVGSANAGKHFIAITDPGSPLAKTAAELNFRKTFLNDPNIGGRYSVLSYFGLVPASLIGMDLNLLLERAISMLHNNESCNSPILGNNSGPWLGTIMGALANLGRDKTTLVASPPISHFGTWVEQLIAESTGKEGKGILPVDGEELLPPEYYGNDRLFVYMRLENDDTSDERVKALVDAGQPVVQLNLRDLYDIGGEFFRWEMAIAVAGMHLGINPFNQPNVEAAKILARKMVAAYQKEGKLPEIDPSLVTDGLKVYSDFSVDSIEDALNRFFALGNTGEDEGKGRSYVTLQAYIKPSPEHDKALHTLRTTIQKKYRLATTQGYGPRFLHSTGQLHKGDAGNGLFIQFLADSPEDVPIPDKPGEPGSSITFGIIKNAAALGDRQALRDVGRNVITFDLGSDIVGGMRKLNESIR